MSSIFTETYNPLQPPRIHRSYAPATRTLTKTDWTSVLKLSTMWIFDAIRETAITELGRLVRAPTERLALSRQFHIPGWTEPALQELARQEELAPADLAALGWDTVAKLLRVRESVALANACLCACNYCTVAHEPVAQGVHPGVHAPVGMRSGIVTAAMLRKTYEFGPKIREVFGTELY